MESFLRWATQWKKSIKLYESHDFDDVKRIFILIHAISDSLCLRWVCLHLWYVGRKGFYSSNCPSPSVFLKLGIWGTRFRIRSLGFQIPPPLPLLLLLGEVMMLELSSSAFDSTLQVAYIVTFVPLLVWEVLEYFCLLKKKKKLKLWCSLGLRAVWEYEICFSIHVFSCHLISLILKLTDNNSHRFPTFDGGKKRKPYLFWRRLVLFVFNSPLRKCISLNGGLVWVRVKYYLEE